jgi:hypothetical protein
LRACSSLPGLNAAAFLRAAALDVHLAEKNAWLPSQLTRLFVSLRDRWRHMRRRRRSLVELAARPSSELHRMAQDAGLSVGGLPAIALANPGHRELLPLRLQLVGLDPAHVRSAHVVAHRDMERTCAM